MVKKVEKEQVVLVVSSSGHHYVGVKEEEDGVEYLKMPALMMYQPANIGGQLRVVPVLTDVGVERLHVLNPAAIGLAGDRLSEAYWRFRASLSNLDIPDPNDLTKVMGKPS